MVLVIDVGNTNIGFGIYKDDELIANWRMATEKNRTADEIGLYFMQMFAHEWINKGDISGVVISSVVPPVMYSIEHAIRKYIQNDYTIVSSQTDLGIKININNPREVGADRLVNAVAAYNLYGGPVIIVDFGTATTFCAINKKGEYLGGAICPGVKISVEALYQNTAKLPRIELIKPSSVIGRDTVSSMQSGVIYGYVGQVEYIVNKMKDILGGGNIRVIATGGLARLIAEETKAIDVIDSLLTLKGLNIIYKRLN